MTDCRDNLGISWHDTAWIHILNTGNVMDYFCQKSNPFYDCTCNNEQVKMQRLNPDQLTNLTGTEYFLLHVQDPILYVIRKQHRHSPSQVTPLGDYYIIAGVVYQAPDLGAVLNSRILSIVNHLQSAFDDTISFSRYNPSKGYWWEFKDQDSQEKKQKVTKPKEDPSSRFQRERVDILLGELYKKFPHKIPQPPQPPEDPAKAAAPEVKTEPSKDKAETSQNPPPTKTAPKREPGPPIKPPPEKKPRLT